MKTELTTYLRAGYPGLCIVTAEEARAEAVVHAACAELERKLHAWSSTEGLVELPEGRANPCPDPLDALVLAERLLGDEEPQHVILMRDLQLHLEAGDPLLVRRLRDTLRTAKVRGHALILLGCRLALPPELEHEFTTVDFGLPGPERLAGVLGEILRSAGRPEPDPEIREAAFRNAAGLTTVEAENVFALSLVRRGDIDPALIAAEKARTLKRSGLLEVVESHEGLGDIGGLEVLKGWLRTRANSFGEAAAAYGLPTPRGLLIVGIPGTGKSLTAKATASAFGLPLLRLDIGRVFGGIVGQSEANLRTVTRTAEAVAPCVLWIDEIEKGFSGTRSSGSTDGGTSARVFGSFLSWMQEKTAPVFVVATANDVTALPPEFLRKGRFDEMFFVDLPDARERAAIWQIVIARHGRAAADYDPDALARACEQFTGAEIEAVFRDALYEAFSNEREPVPADILGALGRTVPLARLMDGQIAALRQWARGRARIAGAEHPGGPDARRVGRPARNARRVTPREN